MRTISKSLIATAISLLALSGAVQAQDRSNVGAGTSAAQAEKDRGVPGVDVGKNAKGAVDVNVNKSNANEPTPSRNETARGVPGVDVDVGRNASGAVDVNTERSQRPARADRN